MAKASALGGTLLKGRDKSGVWASWDSSVDVVEGDLDCRAPIPGPQAPESYQMRASFGGLCTCTGFPGVSAHALPVAWYTSVFQGDVAKACGQFLI